MKKFILAALAVSIATTPVLAAPRDNYNNNRGKAEQTQRKVTKKVVVVKQQNNRQAQKQYRKWAKGQRFDSRYAQNYRVVSNPRQYRLNTAPRGYRWVQSGNDAVLVGITTGIIASILAGAIR